MLSKTSDYIEHKIKDLWGQNEPEDYSPSYYYSPGPFLLTDEAVILIGQKKIAERRNVQFHFCDGENNFIKLINDIKKNGRHAIIFKLSSSHHAAIYLKKQKDTIHWFVCDPVIRETNTNLIKTIIENTSNNSRGYANKIPQQQDRYGCSIFALNMLGHMVDLDKKKLLFPRQKLSMSKTFEYLGMGKLPSVLLKLTQIDKGDVKQAYSHDLRPVNKRNESLSQSLNRVGNISLSTQKAEKYKHHVQEILLHQNEKSIKSIIDKITSNKVYNVTKPLKRISRHGSKDIYNPYKPAMKSSFNL